MLCYRGDYSPVSLESQCYTIAIICFGADLMSNEADQRAAIVVDSDGRSATTSWYEIWEAVNSIAYVKLHLLPLQDPGLERFYPRHAILTLKFTQIHVRSPTR